MVRTEQTDGTTKGKRMKKSDLERATIINPGFSVADAELLSISTSEDGLEIRLLDWREDLVEAIFVDSVSFRWDQIDWAFVEGERHDSSHVIENSDWMAEHLAQNSFSPYSGYKHYRLNFNAGGSLQVIAREIRLRTEHVVGSNDG